MGGTSNSTAWKKKKQTKNHLEQMGFTAPIITFHCLVLAESGLHCAPKTTRGCWHAGIWEGKSKRATTMWGKPGDNAPRSPQGPKSGKIYVLPTEDAAARSLMLLTGKKKLRRKRLFAPGSCSAQENQSRNHFHGMAVLE